MRYLILAFLLLFTFNSSAGLYSSDEAKIFSKQLLKNGGFENGKASWTASGGTFAVTGTSPMEGLYHATWDAAASANTLTSTAVSIPAGMYGRNGVVSCLITTASGTATHTIQAYDGTNILSSVTITSSTTPARSSANFIFPSSGSISLRLYANADEPSVAIDDCYLGPAEGYNVGSVSQATFYGGMENSGGSSCQYSENTSTGITDYDDLGTSTGCGSWTATGNATAYGSNDHRIVFSNMSPGEYQFVLTGTFANTAGGGSCLWRLSDGTTGYQPQLVGVQAASWSITPNLNYHVSVTSGGSKTFKLQAADDISGTCYWGNEANNTATWKVYRFPTSNEQVYKPDVMAQSWSGYHDYTCSWARNNTAYGDFTADASCALTERTNSNFGTVSTSGSVLPAITFTPKRAGRYYVCATFPQIGTAEITANYRLYDGTTTIAEVTTVPSGTQKISTELCGIYVASNTSAKTIKLQGASNAGTITVAAGAVANSSLEWSIFALDNQLPAPLLVNSVVSSASAVYGIESASVGSTGTVTDETGDWISGNCAMSGASSETATCTFVTSKFSATPVCTATCYSNSDCQLTIGSGTSSSQVVVAGANSSGTAAARSFKVICMGPR